MSAMSASEFALALQAARAARGLSAGQAGKLCLISDTQVQGLERDDLSGFYTIAYAERAASAYATALKVPLTLSGAPPFGTAPEVPLIDRSMQLPVDAPTVQESSSPALRRWYGAGLGLLVVLVVVIAVWRSPSAPPEVVQRPLPAAPDFQGSRPPVPATAAVAQQQSDEANEAVAPPPTAEVQMPAELSEEENKSLRFYLVVEQPALVEVQDAMGRPLLAGRQAPTEGRRVPGMPPFSLVTDNPDAIGVYYLDNRIRPMPGADGRFTALFGE